MRGFQAAWRTAILAIILIGATVPAVAQGLSCTGFLHTKDGSWRSLGDGPVLGPNGRIELTNGEILRPTDRSEKGEIARALNALCEGQ